MSERSALLTAPVRSAEPTRDLTPQTKPEREASPPEAFEAGRVPLYSETGIDDEDSERARQTARLIREIAPALGLNPDKLHIIVRSSANLTQRRAAGLELHGQIQLSPTAYDPETPEGRYLLGHELAHTAQRHTGGVSATAEEAEFEAEEIGAAVARGVAFERPAVSLQGQEPAASDADVKSSLEDTVKVTRAREIERIRKALKHIFWISTGDITKALLTLQEMDFFTARAVVRSLGAQRFELVDNINSNHYDRFRPEIFACYAALTPGEIAKLGEGLLIRMDLHELTPEEHLAAVYVLQHLNDDGIRKLQASKNGPAIKAILANNPELAEKEKEREAKAIEEENKRQQAEGEDKSTLEGDQALKADFEEIRARMSDFFIPDSKALAALDRAAKYNHEPAKMQALAHALEDCGALDTLIEQLPMKALFADTLVKRPQEKTKTPYPRRSAFLMLLSYRPAYKNIEKAEELTSLGFFDWAVTDEDAYLAFQLVKSVPQKSRLSFMKADGGDRWKKTISEMTPEMRQAEATNFYSGGKGQIDKASIEAPLADAGLWTPARTSELDGRIRMAIAAGDHMFVFEESRRREAYKTEGLTLLVEKFRLYNPNAVGKDGEPAPRIEYSPELLKGTSFWQEGPFDTLATIGRSLAFVTSLKKKYGGASAKHVSIADIQKLAGGDIAGAAFKSDEEVQEEEKRTGQKLGGGNFLDKFELDMAAGIIIAESRILSLKSIRYFNGDTLIQSGEGTLKGLRVRAGYPQSGTKSYFMKVEVDSITLHDVLVTSGESITAVSSVEIGGAKLTSASQPPGAPDVDYEHQNQGNKDNLFENLIQQIPIFSPLANPILGSIRLGINFLGGDIIKSFKQTGEFSVSADSIAMAGITMSNGEHLDSLELGKASFRTGDQTQGYKRALEASLATFPNRIEREKEKLATASSAEDKAGVQKSVDRLTEQQGKVAAELAQVVADQAAITDLEAKKNAGTLDPAGEQKLADLKRGGTALDIETVKLKGISGRASSGDLSLSNVHGQGRLSKVEEDSDGRPFLQSADGASKLSLDIGDLKTKDLVLKKSPPTAEAVGRQIAALKKKLGENAPDFRTAEKLAQLEALHKDVARYEELARIGAANLSYGERDDFAALRKKLYEQDSRMIGEIGIEGATVDLDFSGGLGALADLRNTLRKAAVGAKSVTFTNLTIPGTGFHADSLTATDPRLSFTPGKDTTEIGFDAAQVIATGLSLQRTKEELKDQARQLRGKALGPADEHRLRDIDKALADLEALADKATTDQKALDGAKGTLGEAKAKEQVDKDKLALQKWQDRLVAQRLSVTGLHATVDLAGDLLSDDFDGDNLTFGARAKFDEAEVTGAEAGPGSAKTAKFTGAEGTVLYGPDKIEIINFGLKTLAITGLNYKGDQMAVSSSGVNVLNGITASATIQYEKGPSGNVLATHANVSQMVIQSIAADNLHYEDTSGKDKLTVDIPSGSLNVVSLTDFDIDIPDDPDGKIASTGKLDVAGVEKLKVLAQVAGGMKASGTVDASALHVEFLNEGDQKINIGDLNVTEGDYVGKDGTHARIRVSHLKGDVNRKKDGTTEFNLPVEKIEVPLLDWRSNGQSVFTDQPLVLSQISVKGFVHQNQTSKTKDIDRFHITRLHINTVAGNYLRYQDKSSGTIFEIKKDDPKQKDPATALRVDGIDAVGLDWQPKKGLTIDNLDVPHMAAAFALQVGKDIKAGGTVKADGINVRILKGGKLVTKVEDLNADIKGEAYGAKFDASLKGLKTTVSKDGDTVTIDPLTIKSIPINQFSYSTPDFGLELPAGAGDITFHDLAAKVRVNLTPKAKPGSAPAGKPAVEPPLIQSIVVDKLAIPRTTGAGFKIKFPSIDATLTVDKGNDLTLGLIELLGPTKGGGPFTVENKSGAWSTLGKIVLTDGDIKKMGFDVAGAITGSTKVHAEGGSLEFTAAGKRFDVNLVKLTELEALKGTGSFKLVTGTGGSSFPGAAAGSGAVLKGIHGNEKGDVSLDEGTVTGLTYDDPATGLHLDLNTIKLPKGVNKESGKSVKIPEVSLDEAKFSIPDVTKLAGGGSGGTSFAPTDKEFLNHLQGDVNTANIVVDLDGVPTQRFPMNVHIDHGSINFSTIEDQLPALLDYAVDFKFDADTGLLRVVVSGDVPLQATVPAPDIKAAEKSHTVRLAVLVNGAPGVRTKGAGRTKNQIIIGGINANLGLDGPTEIDLSGHGKITIASKGKKGNLAFSATGGISPVPGAAAGTAGAPEVVDLKLANLDVGVDKLKFGGTELNATSIAIDSVEDTQLHFSGFSPDKLSGTIKGGKAENIDINFGAASPSGTAAPKKSTP